LALKHLRADPDQILIKQRILFKAVDNLIYHRGSNLSDLNLRNTNKSTHDCLEDSACERCPVWSCNQTRLCDASLHGTVGRFGIIEDVGLGFSLWVRSMWSVAGFQEYKMLELGG
jgi:hypothetical protein